MTTREHLDQLDALRDSSLTSLRNGYPSTPELVQEAEYPSDIEWSWSDGGHSGAAECFGTDTAALIVAAVNALPKHVAAIRAVLDLHVPWYEVDGVRHDNTVTVPCYDFPGCTGTEHVDCPDSDGDGHEAPACYECRCVVDYDIPGHLLWPCPTVRAITGALQ